MRATGIPYSATGSFSKLVLDYLVGSDSLRPFYKYEPSLASFAQAMDDKEDVDRQTLTTVLTEQYQDVQNNGTTVAQIAKLNDSNTYTVTTAHQPVLFGGPMYSLLKVLGVVNLADALNREYPDCHFVPVYLMGSEDHDFAELGHVSLYGKRIDWDDDTKSAVGRMDCGSMQSAIAELEEIAGAGEHATSLMKLIKNTYISGRTLAAATRQLLHHILGERGLVVMDPDDVRLKELCRDIITDELKDGTSKRLVTETSKELEENYHAQTNPMPVNLFWLDDNIRERLVPEGTNFKGNVSGATYSLSQITDDIAKASPNVILRGLMQERILPNLAYIGGGAEVAYWMQYKSLFEHFSVNFPILYLRNSVASLGPAQVKSMEKLQLTTADLFRETDDLIRSIVTSTEDTSLTEEKEAIVKHYDGLLQRLRDADPTLEQAGEGAKQKALKDIERLEDKLVRAAKRKHEETVARITRLKESLFPNGHLQERSESFLYWYLLLGPSFVEELAPHVDLNVFDFQVLTYK